MNESVFQRCRIRGLKALRWLWRRLTTAVLAVLLACVVLVLVIYAGVMMTYLILWVDPVRR